MNEENIFIKVNEIKHRIKIVNKGHKESIVVIHGGPGGNNYAFEQTAGKHLAEKYTMIYYDQRGCGLSDRPQDDSDYLIPELLDDLKKIIEALGLHKPHLLGYSFGGQLALEFGIINGEMISKIIAECPSDFYDFKRTAEVQIDGFMNVADLHFKKSVSRMVTQNGMTIETLDRIWQEADTQTVDRFLFHNPENGKKMRTMWMEGGYENTGLMFNALKANRFGHKIVEQVYKIKNEVLIITGLYDRNCGIKLAENFALNISCCKLKVLKNSAHFPDFEETNEFVKVVEEFLD